jgi:hypothetical protein
MQLFQDAHFANQDFSLMDQVHVNDAQLVKLPVSMHQNIAILALVELNPILITPNVLIVLLEKIQ